MFCDTAKVSLKAGKGGDGAVSFRREIYINKGGPDGGNGGKGGSIIFQADKDTNTLIDFRFNPILIAPDGGNGSGTRSNGRSGKNLIVEVPVGTVVKRDGQVIADLTEDGMQAVIAKGGDGGFGNAHFKSSVRQTPVIAEVGEPGDAFEAEIELKLLADVGLVGLPNAGKSTFLASVTNAKPEIADYSFTTLTPNLGVATIDRHDLLIADIPGLIEGASDGRGLGHDFLRHVDRTAVLLHLIDVYQDDAGQAYRTIRHELEKYSDLKDRFEVVALTKCEGLDDEIIEMQKQAILEVNPEAKIFAISSVAKKNLDDLLRALLASVKDNQKQQEIAAEQIGSTPIEFKTAIISHDTENLPTISLSHHELKKAWQVTQDEKGVYHVTGEKIEKFARRTDLSNYASVNRLRDIMKKLGIRAELTTRGAKADSIIEISGKHFTLVEDY
ncbi:GTPase ObgE [Candidatus Saccharibacteria bacterium]|nr:GTPase ObgE [Candidatus Saccharibacteria bacterium]